MNANEPIKEKLDFYTKEISKKYSVRISHWSKVDGVWTKAAGSGLPREEYKVKKPGTSRRIYTPYGVFDTYVEIQKQTGLNQATVCVRCQKGNAQRAARLDPSLLTEKMRKQNDYSEWYTVEIA
jgi:hypothetical protein